MSVEKIIRAQNGQTTVLAGMKYLHSRYNPCAEAERFVDALEITPLHQYYILIECGLGYIIPLLHAKNPDAKIISLHVSDFFTLEKISVFDCAGSEFCTQWSPSSGSLKEFLEKHIPDTGAKHIKIIEWRPAMDIYPAEYVRIIRETNIYIKRIDANKRTVHNFGWRWFLNTVRNIGRFSKVAIPQKIYADCIVCGAGPSLEKDIPGLRRILYSKKYRPFLVAVSSSLSALSSGGIMPDMVVTSDGGNWALFHLYEYIRNTPRQIPLACCLNAALPSYISQFYTLPIALNNFHAALLQSAKIPFVQIMARGTVSATALDLALFLTSGNIYTTGIDLRIDDVKIHARPYALDVFSYQKTNRFSPWYGQNFEHARAIQDGGSFNIYSDWFEEFYREHSQRIFSFSQAYVPRNETDKAHINWHIHHIPRSLNAAECVSILIDFIQNKNDAAIQQEISELIFDDGKIHTVEEIAHKAYDMSGIHKAHI
ncbi:MAG: DUF115 domain-containing protein [Spirochaetaceae bacterium]|jgi:hypothetical protein|nr:DUF115 domain-containing protein [Spirochaetaceae bacterium]